MKQIIILAVLSLLTLNSLSFAEHQKTPYEKKLLSQPYRIEKFLEAEGNLTIRAIKNILKVGGALICCPLSVVNSTREFIILTFCMTFLYSGGKGIWNDLDEWKAVCFEKDNKQKNNKSPA